MNNNINSSIDMKFESVSLYYIGDVGGSAPHWTCEDQAT